MRQHGPDFQVPDQYDNCSDDCHTRTLLDAFPDSAFLIDTHGVILFLNLKAAEQLGSSQPFLIGRNLWTSFPCEQEDSRREIVEKVIKSGSPAGVRDAFGGREYCVQYYPITRDGEVRQICVFIRDVTEHKEVEVSLREQERKFRILSENASDIIIRYDREFRHCYVNKVIEGVTGIPAADFIGRTHRELGFAEELCAAWEERIRRVFERGVPEQLEVEFEGPQGLAVLDWSLLPELGSDRKVHTVLSFSRNITKLKKSQQALIKSEQRLRVITDNMLDAIGQLDQEGRFEYVSPSIGRMLGIDPDNLVGQSVFARMHPEDREGIRAHLHRLSKEGGEFRGEFRYLTAYGSYIWVEAVAQRAENDQGRPTLVYGAREITHRKRAEQELEQEKKFSEKLVQAANTMIVSMDGQGRIRLFNHAAEKITGYTQNEVLGRDWLTALVPKEWHLTMRNDFKDFRDLPQQYENPVLTKTGEKRIISWRNSVVEQDGSLQVVSFGIDITKQRWTEQKLSEQSAFIQTLMDVVPIPVYLKDHHGIFLACNKAFMDMLGRDRDEILGKTSFAFAPDSHAREHAAMDGLLLQNGGVQHYEFTLQHKSGLQKDVLFTKSVYQLKKDSPARIIGVITDISERKKIEHELAESRRMLSSLLGNLQGMAYRCRNEAHWTMVFVSEGSQTLTGYDAAELVSGNPCFADLIYPDDRTLVWDGVQEAITAGKPYQLIYRIKTRSGETKWVWEQGRGIHSDGKLQALEGFIADISEQKEIEEELTRLSAAVEFSAGAILILASDLTIQYVNPAFSRMSGLQPSEVIGRNVAILYPPGAELAEGTELAIREALSIRKSWQGRLEKIHRDGQKFVVESTITPIVGNKGETTGYAEFWRDVTYEELLKQQLIQTQKMEAIGTLAGGIAHDFNNILASIMGFTEMAQIKSRTGRPVQRDLEMVLKASVRARDLVKQILTFCRKHEQHKQIVHLRPLIKECAKMLRATIPTTIDICLDLGRDGDVVFADPVQMHQVMTNLCSNAAQAMPNGGVLTIILKVQDRDPESMCPSDVEPGTYVHLEVRDTGCGMREDVVDRIFDPFFTTKGSGEGTGMGLPVVHGIVKGHGGSIAVRSTPGEGSSFTVLIPMAEGKEQKHPAQSHSLPRGTGKILFVDDEDTIILLAKSFLGDLGYDVHSTRDSREALEIFKQDPESFDLVITDQTMPHLTGMVLAQNLKAIRPEIPVILCTGYSSTITSTTLEESGVDELLIKPLELHRMAAAIHGFLSR